MVNGADLLARDHGRSRSAVVVDRRRDGDLSVGRHDRLRVDSQASPYTAALLFNVAASIYWIFRHGQWGSAGIVDFVNINIVALAVPSLAWLVLEFQVFQKSPMPKRAGDWMPVHRMAAVLSLALVVLTVAFGLESQLTGLALRATPWIGWCALAACTALVVGCLWDESASFAPAGLYLLGLATVTLIVVQLETPPTEMLRIGAIVLGGYTLITGALFRSRLQLLIWLGRLGAPPRERSTAAGWLIPANLLLAAIVLILGCAADFRFAEFGSRWPSAVAALAQAVAVGLLAGKSRRFGLRQIALVAGVIGTVLGAWSFLPIDVEILNRLVVLMIALAAVTILLATVPGKLLVPRTHGRSRRDRCSRPSSRSPHSRWRSFSLLKSATIYRIAKS